MKYLIDSNIIIYYLNGDNIVKTFLENHTSQCAISLVSYYEILNFNFTEEEEIIVKSFLSTFEILTISQNIINKAIENRKIKKIKMADNFILATTQLFNLTLVTRNEKDFNAFHITIYNPFST